MDEQASRAFFFEIFDARLPRLGPGDASCTQRAFDILLSHVPKPEKPLRILDVGCGNGAQTLALAAHANCQILGLDDHQPFLDALLSRAQHAGVSDQVHVQLADMSTFTGETGAFDGVWSEGALYAMGFLRGLEAYRRCLVRHGVFAVSELCWFSETPPDACRRFFEKEYPDMQTATARLAAMPACGYEVLGHFRLPESAWWDYYGPLEQRLAELRRVYPNDLEKGAALDACQAEVEMYRRFSKHYGYAFFLLRRRD